MWRIIAIIAVLSVIIVSARIVFPAKQTCLNVINFQINQEPLREVDELLQNWHPISVTIIDINSSKFIPQLMCKLFVIFYEYTEEILQQINFPPFTKILIISKILPNLENLEIFYFNKSINILAVYDHDDQRDLTEFLNDDNFIDQLLRNERGIINLRASFFHCPPFVMISKRSDGEVSYDGLEMHCLREIARNWNLSYMDTTHSLHATDLWETTLRAISKNASDVAMCSVWQNEAHAISYDLSSHINIQCLTLLVPKPTLVTQALIIYLPFARDVWLIFVLTLLVTAILIRLSIFIESHIYRNRLDLQYAEFGKILLDMVNIATSHGLFRFPYRFVIKCFLFGWMLTMLLVDTAYSTGYTSIMTIPLYSKSIESVADFINSGLQWGEPKELQTAIYDDIRNTENPDYIRFTETLIIERNRQHRMDLLAERKIGKLCKVHSHKFVTELDRVGDYASSMKTIKECIFNYYTVFAFQKNSPYKKIFDRQISRIKAAGLLDTWFDHLILKYFNETLMAHVLERYSGHNTDEPKKLKLDHFIGGFYLLLTGLSISMAVFWIELLWKNIFERLTLA